MATSMKCSVHALPTSPQTPKSIVHTTHLNWFATPAGAHMAARDNKFLVTSYHSERARLLAALSLEQKM